MKMGLYFRLLLVIVLATLGLGCAAPKAHVRHKPAGHARSVKAVYGIASWYGRDFHGRKTASGEIYNMRAHTAAHKTLPFGTVVRVTNLKNGRRTTVRINDRGPFVAGRIIDLSYRAARDIGILETGVQKVRMEIVSG